MLLLEDEKMQSARVCSRVSPTNCVSIALCIVRKTVEHGRGNIRFRTVQGKRIIASTGPAGFYAIGTFDVSRYGFVSWFATRRVLRYVFRANR